MQRTLFLRGLPAVFVWLFFFQALRVIFSVLFGIIYDRIFEGPMDPWLVISVLLVLAALLLSLLMPRQVDFSWMVVAAIILFLARVGFNINDANVRYWSALIVIAMGVLYLSTALQVAGETVFFGFGMGLVLDQVLRAVGHTYDISLHPSWLPVQIGLSVLLVIGGIWSYRHQRSGVMRGISSGPLWGFGIGGLLFLESSLLSLPHGIARWSEWSYPIILIGVLLVTILPLLFPLRIKSGLHYSGIGRFLVGLLPAGLLISGYFLTGIVSAFALILAQGLALMAGSYLMASTHGRVRSPSGSLALGMGFFLILNFADAFAFTYPYTLPLLREKGWAVYGLAGLGLAIAMIPRKRVSFSERQIAPVFVLGIGVVFLAITAGMIVPEAPAEVSDPDRLRVATYNIHYGYDQAWRFNLEEMANVIEENDVDVIALQEVDTGRLTSYAVDDAYYLSRRLNMNALYLPTIEHLTGIALLYKGSALGQDTRWLSSLQEQTGIAYANLDLGGSSLHAYGTWIGLSKEDTVRQIREALDFIGDHSLAVFGGDFNSESGSPVAEEIQGAGFVDPFTALGIDPAPPTSPAISPQRRIDFVWLRGVSPVQAYVPESVASDHRMVVVELEITP